MHPYEMQRLLRERHWDEVLILKRGSLYHAIHRLLRAGLITSLGTARAGRRPEKTTYQIAPVGEEKLQKWLQEMIAVPVREPSLLMAAVNFMIHLTPADAMAQLEARGHRLEGEISAIEDVLRQVGAVVARCHLLESEYLLWMRKAERQWIHNLLADLRSGTLTWDLKKLFEQLATAGSAGTPQQGPPHAQRN